MRKVRAALIVSVGAGLWGASAACSAVLGITDFTAGDGGPDAMSSRTPDGAIRTCADQDGGAGVIGCPCSVASPTGCNGNAQSQRLVCNGGTWTAGPDCAAGSFCDTRPGNGLGTCATVDPSCASASPNTQICVGADVILCGPDLVSETAVATCTNEACVNGMCMGSCTPGATQCVGTGVQTCNAAGVWADTASCSESCSDGGCTTFPSCQGGGPGATNDCGGGAALVTSEAGAAGDDSGTEAGASSTEAGTPTGTVDCCASPLVPGGMYDRSYDRGASPGGGSTGNGATVSAFRLDQYEVTVGRFRKFVAATTPAGGGWTPPEGSGKHTYLNGGSGLTGVGADAASFESGWSTTWNTNLATSVGGWDTNLACGGNASWTTSAGSNEHQPISCTSWYEAYAFCIWDGGFLPSEAEWNFAASAGTEQRAYPWSAASTIDCSYANYAPNIPYNPSTACSPTGLDDVGSQSPKGDGKWGQADLSGNAWEWALDSYATYQNPCTDCANVAALPTRVARGGAFNLVASALFSAYRGNYAPGTRDGSVGVRCARMP